MRVPCEVICKVCKKIFCCAECRYKHELKNHAIVVRKEMTCDKDGNNNMKSAPTDVTTIYLFCPLCEEKPLVLFEELFHELLDHIEKNHLPLHCRKCAKVYYKIEELKQFSECLHTVKQVNEKEKVLESRLEPTCNVNIVPKMISQSTISTQTSPLVMSERNVNSTTPISLINLRWNAATQCHKITPEVFISDSVSSIRNISSISNTSAVPRGIEMVKGKLVRSTSTPVQAELFFTKPKEHTFTALSNQISICYNSSNDSDNSPALLNPGNTKSSKVPPDNINRHLKVGGRSKMTAVTPLRQVMSKSIQKAFAEHGGLPSHATTRCSTAAFYNRKVMFDFSDSSPSTASTIPGSPLDLRLSPALRRTQNDEVCNTHEINKDAGSGSLRPRTQCLRREILLSSKKLTTESIVITRTRRLANVESSSALTSSVTTSTSSEALNSTNTNYTASTNTNTVESLSSSSSIYKTCRSVEIITSTTELSEVNMQHTDAAQITDELKDELRPLQVLTCSGEASSNNNLAAITPITRIPGALAGKKVIKFVETPNVEMEIQNISTNATHDEVFFTPNSTPIRKSSLQRNSSTDSDTNEQHKKIVSRKLNGRFSPTRRPPLRDYSQSVACKSIEDVADNYDDEVFNPTEASTEQEDKENKTCNDQAKTHTENSWSLGALVSSIIRLPTLTSAASSRSKKHNGADKERHSLLKRCASIAGSLVRPGTKPLLDAEQLSSLKRKRTNTYDNHSSVYLSPFSSSDSSYNNSSMSSKRFRIQGRKPIDRMRADS